MTKNLITISQAAKLTGQSRAMIYHFIKKGLLPAYQKEAEQKYFGHTVMYTIKHVDEDEAKACAAQWENSKNVQAKRFREQVQQAWLNNAAKPHKK